MSIIINKLNKSFGDKIIIDNLSLEIPKGSLVGLIGRNGIGKTTLIRCLLNIDPNYQGQISFGGISNLDPKVFNKVALLHENNVLYPQLTAYDHLAFLTNIYKLPKSRINEVAEQLQIEDYLYKKTSKYSLGMKQHLLIAMALINQPDYLIMDEPFNGLDPSRILEFKKIIKELHHQGVTMILSSHQLALVQNLTSKVYLLKDKNLVPIDLTEKETISHTLKLENKKDISDLLNQAGIPFEYEEDCWKVMGNLSQIINLLVKEGISLQSLESKQADLETIYQDLYTSESVTP